MIERKGKNLNVKLKGGQGIYVEYTGEAVTLICSLIYDARRSHEAGSSPDQTGMLMDIDEDRVTFHVTKKSFKVTLTPKSGRVVKKYFPVKNEDDAKGCLALARRYWNQFDTTSMERYGYNVL